MRATRNAQDLLTLAKHQQFQTLTAIDEGELAHRLYQLMHAGVWGQGKQSFELMASLLWRPRAQWERVSSVFEASYGASLEEKLQKRVAKRHKAVLADILEGHSDKATARLLNEAISDKQSARVKQLLSLAPNASTLSAVEDAYKTLFQKPLNVDARRLGYFEVQQVKALSQGDEATKRAWQVREALRQRKPKKDVIFRQVQAHGHRLLQAYQAQFQTSLLDDVRKGLGDATFRHVQACLILPKPVSSLLPWSHFVDSKPAERFWALELALGVLPPSERKALIRNLEEVYAQPIHEWLGCDKSAQTDALRDGWRPSWAQAFKEELELRPVSEDRILFRLVCLDAETLDDVRQEFLELTGKKLDDAVSSRLTGEAKTAALLALSGQAQTPLQHLDKIEALHRIERGGLENLFARLLLDFVLLSAKGRQFDERTSQLREVYEKALKDDSLSDDEALAMAWVLDATLIHSDTYRNVRDKVRRVARTTATNMTLTAISPLFGVSGNLPRAIIMALGRSTLAATASVASGALIDGGSSSYNNRKEDFFTGLAKGLSLAVVSELSVLSTTLPLLSEGAVSQVVRDALPRLVSELVKASYDSHSKNKPWVNALKSSVKEVFYDSLVSHSVKAIDACLDDVGEWASQLKTVDMKTNCQLTFVFDDGTQTTASFEGEAIEPWRLEKAQKALDKLASKLKTKGVEKLSGIVFSAHEPGHEWLSPLPLVELGRRVGADETRNLARTSRPSLTPDQMAVFGRGKSICRFAPDNPEYDLQETFDYLVLNFDEVTSNLDKHVYKNGDIGRKLQVLLEACFPHVLLERQPAQAASQETLLWSSVNLDDAPLRKVVSGRSLQESVWSAESASP